ncbi:MAG: hypothetical protein LBT16_09465, partial [Treponema sp.]|nr:hypothetical protein [Treponema sp.]
MGIFDRLGDVIKSYLNNDDSALFGKQAGHSGDDDLKDAFEELDEFLSGNQGKSGTGEAGRNAGAQGGSGTAAGGAGDQGRGKGPFSGGDAQKRGRIPPETLRRDFAELG